MPLAQALTGKCKAKEMIKYCSIVSKNVPPLGKTKIND
jgi:hypothetical protein